MNYFQGEPMICHICGKLEQSDAKRESNWRVIELDTTSYYVCQDHFPDDSDSPKAFQRAYAKVLRKIIRSRR